MDQCGPLLLARIDAVLKTSSVCGDEGSLPSAEIFFNPVEVYLQNGQPMYNLIFSD
jgi:hypothetical protein